MQDKVHFISSMQSVM